MLSGRLSISALHTELLYVTQRSNFRPLRGMLDETDSLEYHFFSTRRGDELQGLQSRLSDLPIRCNFGIVPLQGTLRSGLLYLRST
jgi:hypothetical protein